VKPSKSKVKNNIVNDEYYIVNENMVEGRSVRDIDDSED
jgi:hypothetical protein